MQAARLALSLPYAQRLASTSFGVRPVPLFVGLGHPTSNPVVSGSSPLLQALLPVSHSLLPTSNVQDKLVWTK